MRAGKLYPVVNACCGEFASGYHRCKLVSSITACFVTTATRHGPAVDVSEFPTGRMPRRPGNDRMSSNLIRTKVVTMQNSDSTLLYSSAF